MPLQLQLGLGVIHSYRRLSYTPWHAIAELVDNATQSYADNKDSLDFALAASNESFVVGIVYDRPNDLLRVSDNAMGMSLEELTRGTSGWCSSREPHRQVAIRNGHEDIFVLDRQSMDSTHEEAGRNGGTHGISGCRCDRGRKRGPAA